ncbi:MAG: hypothetical protein KA715_00685 [Xanthomonadaceae bacterium]|nr:hypothetical protein [Xanthomonadaceae bacterium]
MSKKQTFWILGSLIVFLAISIGIYNYRANRGDYAQVSWESRDQTVAEIDTSLKGLGIQIRKMAGSGMCEFDNHCKIVGLGSPTCGEYKNYLIYSTMDTDPTELLKLVGEFNQKRQHLDKLSLSVPSCGVAPEKALCIKKRCQINR